MSETIKKSWITDESGNKVAPRTLTSAIQDEDGNAFQNYVDNMIMVSNEESTEISEIISNSSNDIVTFTSNDGEGTAWTDVETMASGETHKSLFSKISTMFKNIRYLFKTLGTTDISKIGDGTVTGGISVLNSNLANLPSLIQSGKFDIVTSTSEKDYTVTFDKQFSSVSSIQLSVSSYGYSDSTSVVTKMYTPTSLTFTVISKNANINQSIYWLVMGK